MATKALIQPQIRVSHLSPPLPNIIEMMIRNNISATNIINSPRNFNKISRFMQQRASFAANEQQQSNVEVSPSISSQIKIQLYDALQGINRGIFGVSSDKKFEIEELVNQLESQNPTFEPTSSLDKRVDIFYNNSGITPDQLMNVFQKNYNLLLGIFNPEGWLEITYVDENLRIGRDDKGNIFVLESVN